MFQKRTSKKVDLLDGISENLNTPLETENQRVIKRIKQNSQISGQINQITQNYMIETQKPFKASYVMNEDNKNRFACEVERIKPHDDITNPVIQTILKFMAVTTIDQIDPKKALPVIQTPKQEESIVRKGPLVAPTSVKNSCRFDYNPSLCKDWHDTGYCTFGDSCIYIHDRGDYKSGWELEKEWDDDQRKRATKLMKTLAGQESSDEELKQALSRYQLPDSCPLCGDDIHKPVVTTCQHIFCEKCALNHFRSSPLCHVCQKPTNGIFSDGKNKIKKLKERRLQIESEHIREKGERKKRPKQVLITSNEELKHNLGLLDEEERPQIVVLDGEDQDDVQELQREFKKANANKKKGFQRTESDWLF